MYRNNPLHTGVAADVVLPPLQLKWKQTFGDKIDSSPAIFGSRLYVGSVDKNLYAIDAATGNIIWSFNDGGGTLVWYSSPAVATVGGQTVIFAGNDNNNVYAIRDDGATPFLLWKFTTLGPGVVDSSPVVTTIAGTQVVIVGANDNGLYALVAATGGLYPGWTTNPFTEVGAGAFWSSPAILGSTVFIGNNKPVLYAINLGNGVKLWDSASTPIPTTITGLVVSSPAIANVAGQDLVFVGADDSKLYAFDAASGALKWSQPVGGKIRSSPALATIPNPPVACAPGPILGVVFGSDDGNVYAMRASDGTPCWTFPSTGHAPFESSPVVSGQTVYIGSDDHSFYAIDINTGTWQSSFPALDKVGSFLGSNPAVSGSTVYFGSEDKRLYALEPFIPVATTTLTSTVSTSTTTTIPVTQTSTVTTTTTTVSTGTTQTETTMTTTTSVSTILTTTWATVSPPSAIPGFPVESILLGLVGGLVALTLLGRKRRRQSSPV
jgi:serine/threonine-protein kinase